MLVLRLNTWHQISTTNARDVVKELVSKQNQVLARRNQNIQWIIAGIELGWTSLNRRERQLMSMKIFLKTEPRGG
jgi:hypothetical protein